MSRLDDLIQEFENSVDGYLTADLVCSNELTDDTNEKCSTINIFCRPSKIDKAPPAEKPLKP